MKSRWTLTVFAAGLVLGFVLTPAQAFPAAVPYASAGQERLVPPPPPKAPAAALPPALGEIEIPAPPEPPQGVTGGVVAPGAPTRQGVTGGVVAQPPKPPAAPAPPVLKRQSQMINVRVELTITNQVGSKAPEKKTIMMLVSDGDRGSIRSNTELWETVEETVAGQTNVKPNVRPVQLAVDAIPEVQGSKIRLRLSLEYHLIGEKGASGTGKTSIRESISVVLSDGVPLTTTLSADPMTDRRVTLEVKAEIVK